MKVAVFGASGNIGSKVCDLLSGSHDLIKIGSKSGDFQIDYTDAESVRSVFEAMTGIDSVIVCVGGDSQFKPYVEITDDDFLYGAERKLGRSIQNSPAL